MTAINTNQPNVINSSNLSYYDDPKLSPREIREITSSVKRDGKVSLLEICLIFGTDKGLFDSGELVEENGFAVLAASLKAPASENKLSPIAEIDRQISECEKSTDPAYRAHAEMLRACVTPNDWWDNMIEEDEKELAQRQLEAEQLLELQKEAARQGEILYIETLKCKNYDRQDSYWLFVGNYDQCYSAQQTLLHEHLVHAALKPNGATGCYKLIVDRIHRGLIEINYQYLEMLKIA